MKNTFLMFVYTRKSSYTWEEIVLLLKDFWWLAVFMILLFVYSLRGYRQYLEEQREQERQREIWGDRTAAETAEVPMREKMEPLEEPAATPMSPRLKWRILSGTFVIGYLVGTDLWRGIFSGGGGIAALLFVAVLLAGMTVMRNLPSDWAYTAFGAEGKDERKGIWKKSLKEMISYGAALLAGLVIGALSGL